MIERDKYDLANLGHYTRCYPNADTVSHFTYNHTTRQVKQKRYEQMLNYSNLLFNEQNGTRPIKDLAVHELLQQNLSKTNPVHTTKAKAFDLVSAIPNHLVSLQCVSLTWLGVLSTTKATQYVGFSSHVVA